MGTINMLCDRKDILVDFLGNYFNIGDIVRITEVQQQNDPSICDDKSNIIHNFVLITNFCFEENHYLTNYTLEYASPSGEATFFEKIHFLNSFQDYKDSFVLIKNPESYSIPEIVSLCELKKFISEKK
jgi:hypothetical protein